MYGLRVRVIGAGIAAAYLVVLAQLVNIQVVDAERNRLLAERKLTWDELTVARRGRILDRKGRVLAVDRPCFDLAVIISKLRLKEVVTRDIASIENLEGDEALLESSAAVERLEAREPLVQSLAALTGIERHEIAEGLYSVMAEAARWGASPQPRTFIRDIPYEAWVRIKVAQEPPGQDGRGGRSTSNGRGAAYDGLTVGAGPVQRLSPPWPGIIAVESTRRSYPCGETACHVLGSLGEFDAEEQYSLFYAGCVVWDGRSRYREFQEMLSQLNAARRTEALELITEELGRLPDPGDLAPELTRVSPERRRPLAEEICGAALTRAVREMDSERRERLAGVVGADWGRIAAWLEREPRVDLSPGELIWVEHRRYLKDRVIGTSGVEAVYNATLRGEHGYKILQRRLASAGGLDYLKETRPRPGSDIRLTIDLDLQRSAETAIARTGHPGAAVVLDPRDGAVLALVSVPSYNPEVFVPPRLPGAARLVSGRIEGKPLLCRATQGLYPPGSTFKPFVASGALEDVEKTHITPSTPLLCEGLIAIPGTTVVHRCLGHHGEVAVREALTRSCNCYFYRAGGKLGVEGLAKWAGQFGFGRPTGIDLPGEASGLVPSKEWKRGELGQGWYLSETYHFAIGQGYLSVTPLQIARAVAAIANGGELRRPYLEMSSGDASPVRRLDIKPQVLATVREGMISVTKEWGGTAHRVFTEPEPGMTDCFYGTFPGVVVAGKTGSAEHPGGKAHSWFVGFAPADRPTVAFAVVVEEAGFGSLVAAPAAVEMLTTYFSTYGPQGHGPPGGSPVSPPPAQVGAPEGAR